MMSRMLIANPSIFDRMLNVGSEKVTFPTLERTSKMSGVKLISSRLCVEYDLRENVRRQDRRKNNRIQSRRRRRNARLGRRVEIPQAFVVDMPNLYALLGLPHG